MSFMSQLNSCIVTLNWYIVTLPVMMFFVFLGYSLPSVKGSKLKLYSWYFVDGWTGVTAGSVIVESFSPMLLPVDISWSFLWNLGFQTSMFAFLHQLSLVPLGILDHNLVLLYGGTLEHFCLGNHSKLVNDNLIIGCFCFMLIRSCSTTWVISCVDPCLVPMPVPNHYERIWIFY